MLEEDEPSELRHYDDVDDMIADLRSLADRLFVGKVIPFQGSLLGLTRGPNRILFDADGQEYPINDAASPVSVDFTF